MRLALLLALASLPARAQHLATGIAAELIAPPAPVEDPGAHVDRATIAPASRVLVAQAAPVVQSPTAAAANTGSVVPVAVAAVPPVAVNPLAPLVPPACVPAGKPFPVWLTVTLAIVGAAVSTLEALHSTGVVGR